jgi:Ca2+-binding RTX toxin-like protein
VNSPFHIFTFVPGTDGETQVTDGSGEIWPAWAPDGRRIAFQRTDTRQIAVHELATGTETTLTGSRAGDFEPDWSPDGKRILFRHGTAISVMDADGTHPRDLHVHGVSAVWAPDGRRIAYFGVPSGALTVLDLATRKKLVLSLDGGGGRISWQRLGPAAYTSETPPKDCRSLAAPIPVRQGSARADRIVATKGRQWIEANGGNDRVRTGAAEDYVEGDAGDDRIETGAGTDRLEGGSGADMLDGGSGDDLLYGGWGRDRIIGGPGNDYVDAHDGARDTVDCGPGRDYVDADRVDRVAPNCEEVRR